jgi:hypothetical protein
MTTVFTLPVLSFERWDPTDPTMPKPDGMLKSDYTFGVIGEQKKTTIIRFRDVLTGLKPVSQLQWLSH